MYSLFSRTGNCTDWPQPSHFAVIWLLKKRQKHTFKGLTLPYPRVKLCGRTPTFLLASFFACIRMWYTTFVMFSYGTGSRNYRYMKKAFHVRLLDSGCMSNFLTESCWSNHRFLNICIYLICTKNKGFSREASKYSLWNCNNDKEKLTILPDILTKC